MSEQLNAVDRATLLETQSKEKYNKTERTGNFQAFNYRNSNVKGFNRKWVRTLFSRYVFGCYKFKSKNNI